MDTALDPAAFTTHRAEIRDGVTLAFVREGIGGLPLLLVHGYPETKRIWWRNIAPLAEAGFEVIAPDLRGHGESDLVPGGFYDLAAYAMDMYSLVHDVLGHERCVTAGGDVGGPVIYDLALRYPGFVTRQCIFNTSAPVLGEIYDEAGLTPDPPRATRQTSDYFVRQGRDGDALMAELDTPERRREWVAAMYGHRLWAAPGKFTRADVEFMTEPYGDADRLRAAWAVYEVAAGTREMEDAPRLFEKTPVPTLVLYGPEDHVITSGFPARMAVACDECIGPFVVEDAGHFLQWEAADVLNGALRYFCGDLLAAHATTR